MIDLIQGQFRIPPFYVTNDAWRDTCFYTIKFSLGFKENGSTITREKMKTFLDFRMTVPLCNSTLSFTEFSTVEQ